MVTENNAIDIFERGYTCAMTAADNGFFESGFKQLEEALIHAKDNHQRLKFKRGWIRILGLQVQAE